jgi:hypothetical protein
MSEEDLRRLIERTHELRGSRVNLGSVPERFAIPVPTGARLLGSVVRGPQDEPDQVTAYLDVPGDPRAAFDALFAARGFAPRARAAFPGQGGGFEHSMGPMGQGATYCAGEDGPYYMLGIGEGDPAPTLVSWHSGLGMGYHPCAPQPHHPMAGMEDVPSLAGPPGVMMQGGGGGGSPGAWYAHGIAFTDMPATALLAHFAAELERSGAQALARDAAGSVAWGRWRLSKKDLETIVGVFAPQSALRLLVRYTYSPQQQARQIRGMAGSSWSRLG